MLKNTEIFSKDNIAGEIKMGERKFRMADDVEFKMERVINLRTSVVTFLGITQSLHGKDCIKFYSTRVKEVFEVMGVLGLTENDTAEAFRFFKDKDNKIILSIYKKVYDVIVEEMNGDGILTTFESIIYSNFKEKAHEYYVQGSKNLENKFAVDFSKDVYLVQQISVLELPNIKEYLDTDKINEVYVLELPKAAQEKRDEYVRTMRRDDAIKIIKRLLNLMNTDEFIESKFSTVEAMDLKLNLDKIITMEEFKR